MIQSLCDAVLDFRWVVFAEAVIVAALHRDFRGRRILEIKHSSVLGI